MSTILDALRKLQRERSAQSPSADLRGSVTNETPSPPARRRRGVSRWVVAGILLLAISGAGGWLYSSGGLDVFGTEESGEDRVATDAELAEVEREVLEQEAAAARAEVAKPRAKLARPALPDGESAMKAPTAQTDSPEIAAERARLEAALVNARAAQEAQRQADRERAEAAQRASAKPEPPAPVVEVERPPPAPPAQSARPKPAARPKPDVAPVAKRSTERETERDAPQSAFPDVQVVSIRWHPSPERRVANLRFERQNAPEAHEGDIIAGVLVHRIDPGAVELRVGSARRTVSPGP